MTTKNLEEQILDLVHEVRAMLEAQTITRQRVIDNDPKPPHTMPGRKAWHRFKRKQK